jgi:hypothetical protein
VFTKDDTLIDIIIVNPTRVIYFATQGFAKFDAVQAKKRNYYD